MKFFEAEKATQPERIEGFLTALLATTLIMTHV
jgi:hypothetical protein